MLYRIQATMSQDFDGWERTWQLPTFYVGLESGCQSAEQALLVARKVAGITEDQAFHATAYCEETGDYAATAHD